MYTYEVWALGYDANGDATDVEIFLGDWEGSKHALEFAAKICSIKDVEEVMDSAERYSFAKLKPEEGEYLTLQVQKCIEMEPEDELDPEEGYTECIDVLYECDLH